VPNPTDPREPTGPTNPTNPTNRVTRMAAEEARERFSAMLSGHEASIDVAEAALCIAAEHTPLDVDFCLRQLAEHAEKALPALETAAELPLADRVGQLNEYFFRDAGFHGCAHDDYHEPRNSFLNQVLTRRSGIPITLSIVYVDVARRLGLRAFGIGFPGHFLCKVEPDGDRGERVAGALAGQSAADAPIVVDPFLGSAISEAECAERLRRTMGPAVEFDSSWLRAARPREILFRVLGNLKHNYVALEDWHAALACADRSLLIFPDAPLELRDRGVLYQRLECFAAAADDLRRFLALAPDHESADRVRQSLARLRTRKQTLH
jgi:regulator of sirC expression with transglutaminase-like and TPR domain